MAFWDVGRQEMVRMKFLSYVAASVLFTGLTVSKPPCGQQQYYDRVVQHCSPCTDICLNARMQGTLEQCHLECPDFQVSESKEETNKETPKTVSANLAAIIIPSAVVFLILFWTFIVCNKWERVRLLATRILISKDPEKQANIEGIEGAREDQTTVMQPFLTDQHRNQNPDEMGATGRTMETTSDEPHVAQDTNRHESPYTPTFG